MSNFIRPKVSVEEVKENVARVEVAPLERGYGDTLGNSLRRVLLSSLEGAAVKAIKIDGVDHEFSTVKGVYEDVTDIVLNVKQLVFKQVAEINDTEATVNIEGPATVTGKDLTVPACFELINPDQVICTLEKGAKFAMRLVLDTGRGYVSAEENQAENGVLGETHEEIGLIYVDSLYSPVRRCAKFVEDCRVGQRTDYDRLIIEVETDGAIGPIEAVSEASNIINQHMVAFMDLSNMPEAGEDDSIFAEEEEEVDQELKRPIESLGLGNRSYNCLKRAEVHTVGDLLQYSEQDLLNLRNFGVKSTEEVKDIVESLGLSLRS